MPPSAPQRRAACATIVVEHLAGGRATSDDRRPRPSRLLLQRLGQLADRARCSSSNSRAFSMAMTAWSANVSSSAICALGERRRVSTADSEDRADRLALAQQRHAEHGRDAELAHRARPGTRLGSASATSGTWIVAPLEDALGPATVSRSIGTARGRPSWPAIGRAPSRRRSRARRRRATDDRRRRLRRARRRSRRWRRARAARSVGDDGDDPQHLGRGGLLLQRLVTAGSVGCAAPAPRTAGRSRWR